MSGFLDKYGITLITAAVGLVLTITGAVIKNDQLLGFGILTLGSAIGMPLNAKWSDKEYIVK